MEKQTLGAKKLSLSRETLRRLTTGELVGVAGGLGKTSVRITCQTSVDVICYLEPAP